MSRSMCTSWIDRFQGEMTDDLWLVTCTGLLMRIQALLSLGPSEFWVDR